MDKFNRRSFLKAGSLLAGGLVLGDSLFAKSNKSSAFGFEPFMSEILIVSFNFPPKGWALCNGQLLPINQNQALFSLLGTTYGGNGQTTFALPDFRGRVPIHVGSGHTLGEKGGEQAHTLSINELPTHIHQVVETKIPNLTIKASSMADNESLNNHYFAKNENAKQRFHSTYDDKMGDNVFPTENIGGSQAHLNMMPFLTLNFIIALQGVFPSQT